MSEINAVRTDKPKPRHFKASGTLWTEVPRKSGCGIWRNYPL